MCIYEAGFPNMVNITKTTTLLFLLRVVNMFVSVVSVTITAKFFGVSIEKDCWILVLTLVTTIVQGVWGPLNEIFRAKFVFIREQDGQEKALQMTSALINFIILVTIFISLALLVFHRPLSSVIIGNIPADATGLFATMLVMLIPSMTLTELTRITTSVLNAFEVFYLPEVIGCITGVVNLALIIVLIPQIGIYALLCSMYVSTILLLLANLYYLKKRNIDIWNLQLKLNFSYVKPFLLYSLPFFLPYIVGQINGISEKYLAALLGSGSVSSLDYSSQFTKILQTVLSSILTTLMVPILAKEYANKEHRQLAILLQENIKISILIMIAVCALISGAAEPICHFFFYRGNVSLEQLSVIIGLTRIYGLTFVGIFLYLLFGYALLSIDKGKQYAIAGVTTQIIVTVLFIIGYKAFGNLYVFPLSVFIAHLASALWMMLKAKLLVSKQLLYFLSYSLMVLVLVSFLNYQYNEHFQTGYDFLDIIISGFIVSFILLIIYVPYAYSTKKILTFTTKYIAKWKKSEKH